MNELFCLCTKHVHFIFNGHIYIHCDGVAIGSFLGLLPVNVLMIVLEDQVLLLLKNNIINWKRYVDDIYSYIKLYKATHILKILNSYYQKIQFRHELEETNKISFLDILVKRTSNNNFETSSLRTSTNTGIKMNWNTYATLTGKQEL